MFQGDVRLVLFVIVRSSAMVVLLGSWRFGGGGLWPGRWIEVERFLSLARVPFR